MMYFMLPQQFHRDGINSFLIDFFKNGDFGQKAATFIAGASGAPVDFKWNGGLNSSAPPFRDMLPPQRKYGFQIVRLDCSNIMITEDLYNDAKCLATLKQMALHNLQVEISNLELMDNIHKIAPFARFVFSEKAALMHDFTPELINTILENDLFDFVKIPLKYATPEFLSQVNDLERIEIVLNGYGPDSEQLDQLMISEQENQIILKQISPLKDDKTYTYSFNDLLSNIPSIEEIIDNFLPLKVNHFSFSDLPEKCSDINYIAFFIGFFIKPEVQEKCFNDIVSYLKIDTEN